MARKFKEKSRNCFDELISRIVTEAIKSSQTGAGRSCTSTATPQAASRRSAIDTISSSQTGAGRSRNQHHRQRAGEMLSRCSHVSTRVRAGHVSRSATAGSGPEPGFSPTGISRLMSLHLGRPNRARRIESTRSQLLPMALPGRVKKSR